MTENIKNITKERVERLAQRMQEMNVDVAVFIDDEDSRSRNVRYFTGHPSDALLIVGRDRHTVLIPWDVNMAAQCAIADEVVPYTKFRCQKVDALKTILGEGAVNMKIYGRKLVAELPPSITHVDYLKITDALSHYDVVVREDGIHAAVTMMRMIKDSHELQCIRHACQVGDVIIDHIEQGIRHHTIVREEDVALVIEREARENGMERTGFDTLAAGPSRSFAIHAFPGYTAQAWPGDGKQGTLSILDFGVVYEGYTSDTTLTVAAGVLTEKQETMLRLVQQAADECTSMYRPGVAIKDAAQKADQIFGTARMTMPHSLGHAIGLDIHELPRVSVNNKVKPREISSSACSEGTCVSEPSIPKQLCVADAADGYFHPGMVLTLEPGLYDAEAGGVRLENDILVTDDAPEVLTHSRIIRV